MLPLLRHCSELTQKLYSPLCRTFGSLTMSGTRSLRLIDELKNNPTILQGLKTELRGILDTELQRRGIPKVRRYFTAFLEFFSSILNVKLGEWRLERVGMEM